jgi:tRNA threonylcarbamoyl adenosine modification protein YjeE
MLPADRDRPSPAVPEPAGGAAPHETGFVRSLADEAATVALAEDLAAILRTGDVVALVGDLGAGKSTLARALIRALADDPALEVPSPTFTLVQAYETPRLAVSHFDLYRLADEEELDELGFDDAVASGAVLIEWPDRAGSRLPDEALIVRIAPGERPQARLVTLEGDARHWAGRLARTFAIRDFLVAGGRGRWHRRHLQGDASTRSYERLHEGKRSLVLMNHPVEADDALGRARVAARAAARLAEGPLPFLALDRALAARGLSVPEIPAHDLDLGLLLLEDLGREPCVAGEPPRPIAERYHEAMTLIADLHADRLPEVIDDGVGGRYAVPVLGTDGYRAEVEILLEWGLPYYVGRGPTVAETERFRAAWAPLFDEIEAGPTNWSLRDYHSPNLLWLAERCGTARVGVLDFQDIAFAHPAYDVASLAQDARVDVPVALEAALVDGYLAARRRRDADFEVVAFRRAYAILAAQRATRLLGQFVRLRVRDGKPGYMCHIPRQWDYLDRVLDEPVLREVRLWYEEAVPHERRRVPPLV